MKISLILAIAAVIVLYVLVRKSSAQQSSAPKHPEVYQGLRDMVLHLDRKKTNIAAPDDPTAPWGAIMDWGLPSGFATVVCLADGTVSVYLSNGGGYVGGGNKESIRNTGLRMLQEAALIQKSTKPTTDYPLPKTSQVTFYLLTDQGIRAVSASEEELQNPNHPLFRLGNAAQEVITKYRELEAEKK